MNVRKKQNIYALLKQTYKDASIALHFSNPWELYVAVVLSAQCTDKRVNIVTKKLFSKYPTLHDYVSAAKEEFENDIRSTGFFRNKAKNILQAAKLVQNQFDGNIPNSMEKILTIPGVARKSANVILGNAYNVVEGIAVDTHVLRISQRLRLVDIASIGGKKTVYFKKKGKQYIDYIKDANPVKIEKELMKVLPRSEWFQSTYYIIEHGRSICNARKPKCSECVLFSLCAASRI